MSESDTLSRREALRETYTLPNQIKISESQKLYDKQQQTKKAFDFRFTSLFACITNLFTSVLGSGKTLTNLFLFWYRMKKIKNAIGFSNLELKNFKPQIQNRIRYFSNFSELEKLLRELDTDTRRIVLEDEAQNEFDKRKATSKGQIHKTYFLNFFRKFNTEMYFNVVNLNRLEFRLEDMCNYIYVPQMIHNKQCNVYELKYGNCFSFNPSFFYKKYNTLEYIAPTFEETNNYIIREITQDKTFNELIQHKAKLGVLKYYIAEKFHISQPRASMIYSLYSIKEGYNKNENSY